MKMTTKLGLIACVTAMGLLGACQNNKSSGSMGTVSGQQCSEKGGSCPDGAKGGSCCDAKKGANMGAVNPNGTCEKGKDCCKAKN